MAASTATITGELYETDGSVAANRTITITDAQNAVQRFRNEVYLPTEVVVATNASGVLGIDDGGFSAGFELRQGTFVMQYQGVNGPVKDVLRVTADHVNAGAAGIYELFDPDPDTVLSDLNQFVADAEDARDTAQEWAEKPEDTEVGPGSFSSFHHSQKAQKAEADAEESRDRAQQDAATASAAATAAAEAIGAEIYTTKSDADAALSGLADGDYAMVLVDETRQDRRTLYAVTAGAFVYVRELGDQTLYSIASREGWTGYLRNTMTTLSKWSDDIVGAIGASNNDIVPLSITASQSGATVTATTSELRKDHVGMRIIWDSGEEAVIVDIDTTSVTNTATVDRSQTVTSGAATIKAKHYIGVLYGDSMGQRWETIFCKLLWRKLGFGGLVIHAGVNNQNSYAQAAAANVAGGASEVADDLAYDEFPWSQRWEIPSGGSVTFGLTNEYALDEFRPKKHGLSAHEMHYDKFVLVWRRGAGAFTVERRRRHQPSWETVETVADASVGGTAFSFRKYTHEPYSDWEYRVTSTSGTIKVPMVILRNDAAPGYLNWSTSRGSRKLTDYAALPSADLAELGQIVGQPDTRMIFVFDADPAETVASATAEMEADRALWQAAMPRTDNVWVQGYEPKSTQAGQVEWNEATNILALKYNDGLVALYDFFGDIDDVSDRKGWISDGLHVNDTGMAIAAWLWFKQVGLEDIPTLRDGRDVSAQRGDFWRLRVLGRDVGQTLTELQTRPVAQDRGLKITNTSSTSVVCENALGAALGTGDFTVSLHIEVGSGDVVYASISSDGRNAASDIGEFVIKQLGDTIRCNLVDGSGNTLTYRWDYFRSIVGIGSRGILTLRADASEGNFDWFWNGRSLEGLVLTSVFGTGTALGSWSGVGQDFSVFGSTLADAPTYYHAMAWRSKLTDAQIKAIAEADDPAGTSPDFWWDFRGQAGRSVRDISGNGKHGLVRIANPSAVYRLTPDNLRWANPDASRLGNLSISDINSAAYLIVGDNMVVSQSANRDWLLPTTAEIGDMIRMTINTSATIRVTQNAGQQIKSGASSTTAGTGGSLTIPDVSSVTLRCITGGASTVWVVESHTGAALTFT